MPVYSAREASKMEDREGEGEREREREGEEENGDRE
jgi:hypothetical protein